MMRTPSQKVSNVLLGKSEGQLIITPEKMEQLGQSKKKEKKKSSHLWPCLVMKLKDTCSLKGKL